MAVDMVHFHNGSSSVEVVMTDLNKSKSFSRNLIAHRGTIILILCIRRGQSGIMNTFC